MSETPDPYLDAMLQGREAAPAETPVDEAAPEAPEPEAPPEAEKPETERNPDGTYKKQPDEPEAETPEPELILGKFKDPEALAKSYTELEKHLGELRTDLAAFKQQQDAQEAQAQTERQDLAAQRQPGPSYDLTEVEERLIDNPTKIYPVALQAWQEGNQDLVDIALSAWRQYDEKGARQFERWTLKQELAAEYQQWSQPIQQHVAETQQTGQQQQAAEVGATAFRAVAERFPDIHDMQHDIFEVAQSAPEIAVALASGDQPTAERAYENLRALILGRRADQLKVEQDKISAEQAAANDAARKDAVVASASSAKALAGGEGAKKKPADLLTEMYTQADESHLPYWERSDYVAG